MPRSRRKSSSSSSSAPPKGGKGKVRFDARKKHFRMGSGRDSRALKGVTKVLKSTFYRDFSLSLARKGVTPAHAAARFPLPKGSKTGQQLGTFVEKQLCQAMKKPPKTEKGKKRLHPWTRELLRLLTHDLGLVIEKDQVPVRDKVGKLATGVDIVCRRKGVPQGGPVVLIEVKTGYRLKWRAHTGHKMAAPFQTKPDSPKWQHHLQLCLTRKLYELTFPKRTVEAAYIVLVNGDGADKHPLDASVWAKRGHVLSKCQKTAGLGKGAKGARQ